MAFATQLSSNMQPQNSRNQQLQHTFPLMDSHVDITLDHHKLQKETNNLCDLRAEREEHNNGLQQAVTELQKELQPTKTQFRYERYFKSRRMRITEAKGTKDFQRVLATVRENDEDYRRDFKNFRKWTERRRKFVPVPNRRPLYKRPYDQLPSDADAEHGHTSSNQMLAVSRNTLKQMKP